MKQTEKKIKNAFTAITPDILENVIRDSEREKGTVITVKKRRIFPIAAIATAAVIALLFGLTVGVLNYIGRDAVSSVVSIDVNPGIELKLNRKDIVVEVTHLNEDGKKIIGNMNLVGTDVETAVNAIIGSLLTNGYITEIQNSVLISVENDNSRKNQRLREKLNDAITLIFENGDSQYAVITQKVKTDDAETQLFSEKYGISLGKAQIIKKLCVHNSKYTSEALAKLSINELSLLLESLGVGINGELNCESSGTASTKAYIEKQDAVDAAIEFLNLPKDTVIKKQKASLDFDDGIMVYEVKIYTELIEYEVEVNAQTGEVVSTEQEVLDFIISEGNILSEDDIKDILNKYYGFPVKNIYMDIELKRSDGRLNYEVEFVYQGAEYEFDISAINGSVLRYKTSVPGNNSQSGNVSHDTYISESQALDNALSYVNLTQDEISELNIKLDEDDGVWVYEIEFNSGYFRYEIEINAKNGTVIDSDREID